MLNNKARAYGNRKVVHGVITFIMLIAAIFAGALSTPIFSGTEKIYADEYEKTHSALDTNMCGNGLDSVSVLCQNLSSEIQGNENAMNIIGLQTATTADQILKSVLKVTKIVICPEDVICPTPSDFILSVSGNNPSPSSFPGSDQGTSVRLEPGTYSVSEKSPSSPPELTLRTSFSPGCSGSIDSGEFLTCTVVNQYAIFECGPTQNLSESPEDSFAPAVATSGNNVYTVWLEPIPGTTADLNTFFIKSNDGGVVFGQTENISNNDDSGNSTLAAPQVAASGNNVYVVWGNGNEDIGSNIWLKRSTDGGNSFEPMVNLGEGAEPQILASGDNVYVAWLGRVNGVLALAFTRSTDGGANFEPVKSLWPSMDTGIQDTVRLAASGNNVAVVWQQFNTPGSINILFTSSTDGGANFNPVKNLGEMLDVAEPQPQVAASGNNIYVVWKGEDGLAFTRSIDAGANFEPVKNLAEEPPIIFNFDMAVSGQSVNIVWSQNNDDDTRRDIFLVRSTDGGANFEIVKNLSRNDNVANDAPKIASNSNLLYVVWTSFTDFHETTGSISLTRSVDGGANFGPVKNVSGDIPPLQNPNILPFPELAISGKNSYVVWPGPGPVAVDIFFARCM
jgi:hypothetical protein